MSTSGGKGTIMFVHGLWLSPKSWEHWIPRFEGLGYEVLAPAWPGVAELDEPHDPDKAPADLGVGEIVDHYVSIIGGLDAKPIVVGHSFGGLIAEILNDRGLATAVVALSPAPAKGVYRLPIASLRTASVTLRNPANLHRAVKLSPAQWQYSFTNTQPEAEGKAFYDAYAIPGPGRTLFQAATANFNPNAVTKVDFHNPDRAPDAVRGGERGPHGPRVGHPRGLQAPHQVAGAHRLPRVRGPRPLHGRRPGVGGRRRPRGGLGRRGDQARVTSALVTAIPHPHVKVEGWPTRGRC